MPKKNDLINLDFETEFIYIRSTHSEDWDEQIAKHVSGALVLYEDVSTEELRHGMQALINRLAADKKEAVAYLNGLRTRPEQFKIMPHIAALCTAANGRLAHYVPVDKTIADGQTLDDILFKEVDPSGDLLDDLAPALRSVHSVLLGALAAIDERDALTIDQIEEARFQYRPSKVVLLQGINHRAGSLYFQHHPQLNYREVLLPNTARPGLEFQQLLFADYDRYKTLHAHAFMLSMVKLVLDGKLNVSAARDARKDWGALDAARKQVLRGMDDTYWRTIGKILKLAGAPLKREYKRAAESFTRSLE